MNLQAIPFFAKISPRRLEQIKPRVVSVSYPAKQLILLEHDWGDSVYFIGEGWVRIRAHDTEGKDISLGILGQYDLFGEMSVFSDQDTRSADVVTITATSLIKISSSDFESILRDEPDTAFYLLQLMTERIRRMNKVLIDRELDSTKRLAVVLLALGQTSTAESSLLELLSHGDFGSLSGLRRETVTRCLTKLRQKGLIEKCETGLIVPNLDALEDYIS